MGQLQSVTKLVLMEEVTLIQQTYFTLRMEQVALSMPVDTDNIRFSLSIFLRRMRLMCMQVSNYSRS